uniref:YybH family protein n=1 Tax=uncultured Draconibacterium sp. TaxID=1573823 RepID=UPI003216D2B4
MLNRKIKLRTTKAILLLVLTLGILGCKQSANVNPGLNTEAEKEEIKSALNDMWNAIEHDDIERYAKYIHPDFTQFGETDPVLLEGKETEVNATLAWIKDSKNIHTEMLDPKITINGNVAWITYYWSDHGTTNGKEFSSSGKSTRIFVKENGKWLCIHGHYTLLP